MSIMTKSLKVDLDIHKKILWFRDRKLITVSISEFVNNTLREKLDAIGHGQGERMLREKLDEIIVEFGKQSLRLDKIQEERKTHTQRSRKVKKKK